MLDNIRPYKMIFIQKASPNVGDAFDFAYIYLKSATIIQYTIKGRFMSR